MNYLEARVEMCLRNREGRDVVVWGAGRNCNLILKYLEKKQLSAKHIVDTYSDGSNISPPDILADKADQYYVIVSIKEVYEEVIAFLEEEGYRRMLDYVYIPQIKNIKWNRLSGNYFEDEFGNRAIGSLQGMELLFYGYCSEVVIKGVICDRGSRLKLGSCAKLEIGENTAFNRVGMEEAACRITISDYASLKIGSDATFAGNNYFALNPHIHCIIGNDCMFSTNTIIRPGDGHPIIDLETGEVLNSPLDKEVHLQIGEHVWVGERTHIIHGIKIGNGSIIGAESLVNKDIAENCMVAGVPARIIRENVSWKREFDF